MQELGSCNVIATTAESTGQRPNYPEWRNTLSIMPLIPNNKTSTPTTGLIKNI